MPNGHDRNQTKKLIFVRQVPLKRRRAVKYKKLPVRLLVSEDRKEGLLLMMSVVEAGGFLRSIMDKRELSESAMANAKRLSQELKEFKFEIIKEEKNESAKHC